MKALRWLRSRLQERSTFVGIGMAISGAAVLPSPFSWLSLVCGTLGALVPDGKVGEQ